MNVTWGQIEALTKLTAGSATVVYGVMTGNAPMVQVAAPIAFEGLLQSTIEFGFNGDTTNIPLPSKMLYQIGEGIIDYISYTPKPVSGGRR